jgi:hypothetical protein
LIPGVSVAAEPEVPPQKRRTNRRAQGQNPAPRV